MAMLQLQTNEKEVPMIFGGFLTTPVEDDILDEHLLCDFRVVLYMSELLISLR